MIFSFLCVSENIVEKIARMLRSFSWKVTPYLESTNFHPCSHDIVSRLHACSSVLSPLYLSGDPLLKLSIFGHLKLFLTFFKVSRLLSFF